jgi:hypothetical protein
MRTIRFAAALLLCALAAAAQPHRTRNIVLVTADGLRWQEVFRGIDPMLAHEKSAGMENAEDRRKRYQRPTERESREALLPFFWKLAPLGLILADVKVTNAYHVSYPGYSEILTGRASDDLIRGNDPIRNPNETVLEYFKRQLKLDSKQVALFGSWDTFRVIGEHTPGTIFINAGYQEIGLPHLSPELSLLSRLQFEALTPWDEARHDAFTFEMALDYLKTIKPRVLHIALDETDDWAHSHRYDRVLDSIASFDRYLALLWNTLQSMKEYRDSTTLIVTSDHGRGSTVADWSDHGSKVPGADRIWLAIVGPDTRAAGEQDIRAAQRDIAETMLALMGLDPAGYSGTTGAPIRAALP